ncbi:MAG: hypothetical protein GX222_07780 [Ruminococcaceae bacterium]|nr:hypothetical protein [Oscillospiraceae bacterium]
MDKTKQEIIDIDDTPGLVRIRIFEDEEYGILPLYAFRPTPGKPDINTLEGWNAYCAESSGKEKTK